MRALSCALHSQPKRPQVLLGYVQVSGSKREARASAGRSQAQVRVPDAVPDMRQADTVSLLRQALPLQVVQPEGCRVRHGGD